MIQYLNPYTYTKPSRYAKLRTIKKEGVDDSYHEVVNATPLVDVSDCQLFRVTGKYINRLDSTETLHSGGTLLSRMLFPISMSSLLILFFRFLHMIL